MATDNAEYNKKYRVQVILTPLCRDIVEYTNEINFTSRSSICSDIITENYKDPSKIPAGFWEWRKKKLKGAN